MQTLEVLYSNDSSITNNTPISKGGISVILSGVNKETYTLTTSHLEFVVISPNVEAPALTELIASSIGQTYCQINIGANEIVIAYYMIALTGTATPSYDEIVNQGPINYTTTQNQYGVVFIGSSNRVTITVKNLYAQTPYTIYVYLKNRGLNINKAKTMDFVTSNRYPACEFSLQFLQAYLNKAEKQSIMTTIAFVLSMPPGNIYVKNYTFATSLRGLPENHNENTLISPEFNEDSMNLFNEEPEIELPHNINNAEYEIQTNHSILVPNSRTLATTETVSTILTLWMFSVTNSANYPSPYNMGSLLRNKTSTLRSMLTNFDSSYVIPVKTFTSYTPSFVEPPTTPIVDQFFVEVQGKLDNFGFIYAVALNASQDKSKPSSFQVYNGFDSENVPCQSGFIEASAAFTYFAFNITNLSANTQYNLYITAGSVHPGYPDLISDKTIVLVAVTTKPLIICTFTKLYIILNICF